MIKFELDKFGRYVPDEELIADLKYISCELRSDSLTQREYKKHGKFGVTIFYNRFGSWSNALVKADLKSGKSRTNIIIGDKELIADLKQVSLELKNDSVTRNEYNQHGKFHSSTFEDRFGSWIKAKESAGLRRREHPSISDEEYFINLEDVWIKLGMQPHFSDMKIPLSKYSGSGYVHNFGTWRKALEHFMVYVSKIEETKDEGEKAIITKGEKPTQPLIIEQPNKELIPESVIDLSLAKNHKKTSQQQINKHRTKREANDRLKFMIMKRDNFKCRICGRSPASDHKIKLHIDHILPWSKGGETTFENLQTLCSKCNKGKGNLRQ